MSVNNSDIEVYILHYTKGYAVWGSLTGILCRYNE